MISVFLAAPSRRGDLEILGYVMLQWLCGHLPWEDNLTDKEYVKAQKIRYICCYTMQLLGRFSSRREEKQGK